MASEPYTQSSILATVAEPAVLFEIERGKPMPSKNHSKVQTRIASALSAKYENEFDVLTELDIELAGKKSVPDVVVYPYETSDWENDVIRSIQLPSLIIEILSPRQSFDEVVSKIRTIYFPAGVKSVWFVTPSTQSLLHFIPNQKPKKYNEGIFKDKVSGFEIDLDRLFR